MISATLSEMNRFSEGPKYIYILHEAKSYYPSRKEEEEIYRIYRMKTLKNMAKYFHHLEQKKPLFSEISGKIQRLPSYLPNFVGFEPVRSKGLIQAIYPERDNCVTVSLPTKLFS